MPSYAALIVCPAGETKIQKMQFQDAWIREMIFHGIASSNAEDWDGHVDIAVQLGTGMRVPSYSPTSFYNAFTMFKGCRLTIPVNERLPYPHEMIATVRNADDSAHSVEIIVITEELPLTALRKQMDEKNEIT